jgi:hypothetical protein
MKKLLTLDDRIKQDLEDLYNKGEIDGAVDLDGLVKKENEGIYWINKKEDGAFTPKEKKVVELLKSNSGISIEQLAVQAQMDVNSLNELLENLKKNKCWDEVRKLYLDKKNNNKLNKKSRHLRAEAINEVFQWYFEK